MTIVRMTLREAASRRLLLAVVVLSAIFVGLFALGFWFASNEFEKQDTPAFDKAVTSTMLTVLGLYVTSFLAAFLALFLSAGSVSSEIDSGQLHAVLARPITRWSWLVQRWTGFAIVVATYVLLLGGSLLVVSRIMVGYEAVKPFTGLGLMILQSLTLLTIGILGSTRLSTLANGAVVFFAFGLAWMSGLIEFIGRTIDNSAMEHIGVITSLLIPSDALWRGASAALSSPVMLASYSSEDFELPFTAVNLPSVAMLTWSILYVPALLLLAGRTFSRRDL